MIIRPDKLYHHFYQNNFLCLLTSHNIPYSKSVIPMDTNLFYYFDFNASALDSKLSSHEIPLPSLLALIYVSDTGETLCMW